MHADLLDVGLQPTIGTAEHAHNPRRRAGPARGRREQAAERLHAAERHRRRVRWVWVVVEADVPDVPVSYGVMPSDDSIMPSCCCGYWKA